MSDLLTDQFERMLDAIPPARPWPTLAESGFLDLMRSEAEGGAGMGLEVLFPLALSAGRRAQAPPIIDAMLARIVFARATEVADPEAALVDGGVAPDRARALAAAAAAAQMVGTLERMLQITLDYATTRKQFGREIGRFQAVQHQIAVAAEEVMAGRMAAQLACRGAALEVSEFSAGIAKARVGQAATPVCAVAHAILGAIGVTQEHELHHHSRALRKLQLRHGGEAWWMRRVGTRVIASGQDCATLARDF
jgi:alkylation response protein AidB-like acyl-CoA dehydrogenase